MQSQQRPVVAASAIVLCLAVNCAAPSKSPGQDVRSPNPNQTVLSRDSSVLVVHQSDVDDVELLASIVAAIEAGTTAIVLFAEDPGPLAECVRKTVAFQKASPHIATISLDKPNNPAAVQMIEWKSDFNDPSNTSTARFFLNGEFTGIGTAGFQTLMDRLSEKEKSLFILKGTPYATKQLALHLKPFPLEVLERIAQDTSAELVELDRDTGLPIYRMQ
jgi:hypothetical protein